MQLLKDRIRKDGKVGAGDVLKVDSFLNHQMDIELLMNLVRSLKGVLQMQKLIRFLQLKLLVSVLPVL